MKKKIQILAVVFSVLAVCALATRANASGITFDVIAPHEYDLPVNFPSFNALVQYTYYNNDSNAYDIPASKTDTVVGMTKYVRFFTLSCAPNIGLAYEVILPEVSISGNGTDASGLGDPITGPAIWFKPTSNSTLGFQTFLQVPVGQDDVSNHSWANLSSIFFDANFGKFNIDGDIGGVFRSTRQISGTPDVNVGPLFHTNVRFAYRIHPVFEPYFSFDFQYKSSDDYADTGNKVQYSEGHETALGGGFVIYFTDKISAALGYSHAVEGENVTQTNAVHLKFAYLW